MALFLHDSLRGKKVLFKPINPKRVTMYLCGPTVYDHAHIGNARPAVVFDVLVRLLRRSYELTFVRNITDLDDKINEAALQLGKPISNVTQRYIESYNADIICLQEMSHSSFKLLDPLIKGYSYDDFSNNDTSTILDASIVTHRDSWDKKTEEKLFNILKRYKEKN